LIQAKKLEFDVSNLTKSATRKLFKFINSIPNIKKITKKESKKIDPNYHLKQINTKLSNEFGSDRSNLIESVIQNKTIDNSNATKNNKTASEEDTSRDQYYSKLLEESSSSSSDDEDNTENGEQGSNNFLKNNKQLNKTSSENSKVMWNWNSSVVKKAKYNSDNKNIPQLHNKTGGSVQPKFSIPSLIKRNGINNAIGDVKGSLSLTNNSFMMNSDGMNNWGETLLSKKEGNQNFRRPTQPLPAKDAARIQREQQQAVEINLQQSSFLSLQKRFQ